EDIALADVLLRSLDPAEVFVAGRLAFERPTRCRAARQRGGRTVEGARLAPQHLGDPAGVVEAEQDVRDEKKARRHVWPILRQRNRWLERRHRVVAEIADHGLAESVSVLERDEPRSRADEAVAAEPPTLDRLEQERSAGGVAQAQVRPEWRQKVGCELDIGHEKGSSRSRVERTGCTGAFSVRAGSRHARCARPTGCGRKSRQERRWALRRRQAAKTWPASSRASAARARSAERTR